MKVKLEDHRLSIVKIVDDFRVKRDYDLVNNSTSKFMKEYEDVDDSRMCTPMQRKPCRRA